MQGEFFLAWSKRSRTRLAPTPTNISTNSDPEMLKNGTPASPATARERRVLPVPGGPTRRTPRGIRAPRAANLSGYFRNSTTSCSSSLASSTPATSANVTDGRLLVKSRALLLPNDIACELLPWFCRIMKAKNPISRSVGSRNGRNPRSPPQRLPRSTSMLSVDASTW